MRLIKASKSIVALHVSFIFVIIGGLITCFSGQSGTIHLKPGMAACEFISADSTVHRLPFSLTLLKFDIERHRGMPTPKDFKSEVIASSGDTLQISMNHIGKVRGYRFCQSSFDNEGGTVLSVSHDPAGIAVVYLGFALFAIAGAWVLAKRLRRLAAIFLLCAVAPAAFAVPAVGTAYADSLGLRQVLYNGEVMPFSTVASRLTYKLTGRARVASLSPEAFVASLIIYKEEWYHVPFLKVKSKALRKALGVEGDYVAVASLYDANQNYLPGTLYKGGEGFLDKDIVVLDEKIELLMHLWSGELFEPLPKDDGAARSSASIAAEVAYNRMVPVKWLFMIAVSLGMLALLTAVMHRNLRMWLAAALLAVAGWAAFVWHCSISAHFPLSATYEIMEFTATVLASLAAIVGWRTRSALLTGLALTASAFLYLVSWLGLKDPVMSPVMPVLASPWLSVHVSLVMIAYAILGLTMPISLCAIALPRRRASLAKTVDVLLFPGVYLLGLGIITGAMWANVSWGRYWGWDPKETWALVTFLLYALPLHRSVGLRRRSLAFNIYIFLIFLSIVMTYYGVNFMSSLHAYQ